MQAKQIVATTEALYQLDDESNYGSELAVAYSQYKLGDVGCRHRFISELASLIVERLGDELNERMQDWVIATPATTELALDFAEYLQVQLSHAEKLPVQIVGPDPCPGSDYTDCSKEQRDTIVSSFYDFNANLTGKHFLVIDDLVNTGTALAELYRQLIQAGVSSEQIHAFVFVRGAFSDPKREAELVKSVIDRMSLDSILAILAHPDHYLTSATMLKYLSGRSSHDLAAIANALPEQSLERLQSGLKRYYRNHAIPRQMQVLIDTPAAHATSEVI